MLFTFDGTAFGGELREVDDWRERLDHASPVRVRFEVRLRRDLEAEAVAASTRLEGLPVTIDEVRRILAGERPETVERADQSLVLGYRDAIQYALRRADDPAFAWNSELLIGMHDRILAGQRDQGAGSFRQGAVSVGSRDGGPVFAPPDWRQVPALVDEACTTVADAGWHPAFAAAWIHVAIAAIHPFRDGTGRAARVLASLAMFRGGFRRPAFTSLEEWWGAHPDDYYRAFECLGRRFDPSTDVTPFVRAHLAAQLSQVRALDLRQKTEHQLWTLIANLLERSNLPERIAFAVWDAFFGREVTAGYYRGLVDVSAATVTADLKSATLIGLLDAHGQRRGRHYTASATLYTQLGDALAIEIPLNPEGARTAIVAELAKRVGG